MPQVTRREFVRTAALATAAAKIATSLRAADVPAPAVAPAPSAPLPADHVQLRWLEGKPADAFGTTWGVAWPRGQQTKNATFALRTSAGASIPVQSWPLATWPDGSLKWTAHAVPADAPLAENYALAPGASGEPVRRLVVHETADAFEIDTAVIRCRVARRGSTLIESITREGEEIARGGVLVCLRQNAAELAAGESAAREEFVSRIDNVTLEQNGPVRAVVKIEGKHAGAQRAWLPFVVRLYFYAGGDSVRAMHTIVYDGDEHKDFIAGLGLRFGVPMRDAPYDRHVRFVGEDNGVWAEAIQGLTGLRRDPGAAVRAAQLEGRACPPQSEWSKAVVDGLKYVPVWSDYSLAQLSADGFEIHKRTKAGYTWIKSASGRRSTGAGYLGGPSGGVSFGLRNFWQSYPSELAIHGAATDEASVTLWFWSPRAAAMDLRGYHDEMGEDTYAKQSDGLDITYEDYEPGFDKPEGVARTSEIFLRALPATPTRERLAEFAKAVQAPPLLVARPEYLASCRVFGGLWSPSNRSRPARAELEDELDWYFKYYVNQREQRHWYGFWNYGDVMHTYDVDRHVWRYDVGGFAWDNSELSTDIWLWLYFLSSGRADVFRFAEAMTRHTGEVDVHHLGRFAPLGSRHNVLHWGCSAKQLRISTAANRRYYYYLTGDERFGDLMREQIEAVRTLVRIQPGRKLASARAPGDLARDFETDSEHAGVGFGTDWGAVAGAWLTEWERTGDTRIRERLLAGMRSIAAQPKGFFTGSSRMNLTTGAFDLAKDTKPRVSHLTAVFGLTEICAELVQLCDEPEFTRAWLEYCELYSASAEEQEKILGVKLTGTNLRQGHSRLTAFAAAMKHDSRLAARAWEEYRTGDGRGERRRKLETRHLAGPEVFTPIDEAAFVSTNGTAQWGLATIQCLSLIGDHLPANLADKAAGPAADAHGR
jgi:hypothetical protein